MQWTSAPNIGEAPLPQRARGYWKVRFSALHGELERLLEAERAQLPPWFVVGFGSGIAGWFALAAALGCGLVWARGTWVELPRLSRPVVTDVSGRRSSRREGHGTH